jgi:hypothetical protein
MTSGRAFLFTVLSVVTLLAACDEKPPEPAATTPATTSAKPKPKTAGLPPDMVAAVSASRISTAISMHFSLGNLPVVNQALPVEIAIVPHREFASVSAHFDGRDGLALANGADFGPSLNANVEKPLKHQLVLLPTQEGMFMITASVQTESEEGSVTRVFSIPVIVGPAATQTPAAAQNPPVVPAGTTPN